jgi:DNA-directed RNA polymerase subunit RPC12/RpoP
MKSSKAFTFPVMSAPGVDPKQLEMPIPLSFDAVVAAIHEAIPVPPWADEFAVCPSLVSDHGSSQRCTPPCHFLCANALETDSYPCSSSPLPNTSQTHYHPSPPQTHSHHGSFYSPTTLAPSPSPSTARVLVEAPCAGGMPIEQKSGGYVCSGCDRPFKRREDAKRHIGSAGMQVSCRYCGKPASGRRDNMRRHLRNNQACWQVWEAGHKAGRFTGRSVEDAYNLGRDDEQTSGV